MKSENKTILWGVYLLYAIIIATGLYNHEFWGDELHSWNFAKGSTDYLKLLDSIRYEGHPPIWYTLLWVLSKFTHEVFYIKYLHFTIALGMTSVVLFLSPFPIILRVLMVFGYYFLFEYAVLSRNYSIGLLFAFLALYFQGSHVRFKKFGYYLMLFCASNTHLLVCLLAISIHIGHGFGDSTKKLSWRYIFSFLIFLPATYFIFPPSDSGYGFMINKWQMNQLFIFFQIPLKSFFSFPSLWEYHFWNSNVFLDQHIGPSWIRKPLAFSVSVSAILIIYYLLSGNKKAKYLIFSAIFGTYIFNTLMPFTSMRYVGLFYFSFLCGLWFLYLDHTKLSPIKRNLLILILIIQIPRGIFSLYNDFNLPFSNAKSVIDMSKKLPEKSHVISTYWCINNLSAFMNKSYYCIETKRVESYIVWDSRIKSLVLDSMPYKNGLDFYFKRSSKNYVYLFSTLSTSEIFQIDSTALKQYNFITVQKSEGAIEQSGNVYLYKINPK